MPKLPNVPPTLQTVVNEFLDQQAAAPTRLCDKVDNAVISELIEQYGSPLFIFSEQTLRKQYRDAYRAFSPRYPDVQFAWSYKTNYLKAICNVFHSEGSIAEVVSDFEYQKARASRISGCDIIVNGPCKPAELLRTAITEQAKIQIDNFGEIERLNAIAGELGETVDVAIRLTLETGVEPAWSKFGFCYETGEAMRAIRQIDQSKNLRLVGLHNHVGTFILDPQKYRIAMTKVLTIAAQARDEFGVTIEYINAGGGFASQNTLHHQYRPGEEIPPSFDDYAEAICGTLLEQLPPGMAPPKLYLETGRAMVDQAGYLATTVIDSRIRGDDRRSVIVDAGVNLLHITDWCKFNIHPVQPITGPHEATTVYGPLCMNTDVVRGDAPLPPLTAGDQLVIHPVGAYNVTQSMQFIMYRPAVIMVGTNGAIDVIRQRECLRDVESLERLPERLKSAASSR